MSRISAATDSLRLGALRRAHTRRTAASPVAQELALHATHSSGLALADVLGHASRAPHVTLLLPTASKEGLFAGVRTALRTGALVSTATGVPLRILTMDAGPGAADRAALRRELRGELGLGHESVHMGPVWDERGGAHPDDLWIVTYWTTAHAAQTASQAALLDARRVLHLVQDHEPSFFAASGESATASAVHRAGFRTLVNSRPLQAHLARHEGLVVDDRAVFRPALDERRLARAAARRRPSDTVRLGFYARPGKPRNAFALGAAALAQAMPDLRAHGVAVDVLTMGSRHPALVGTGGVDVRCLGRVSWDGYFDVLADVDVLLSLQMTPHPSHPPLDAVASGGRAVTNDVHGTRTSLSTRLGATSADAPALARALVAAARSARDEGPAPYDDGFVRSLGAPLANAVDHVLAEVGT